MRPVYSAFTLIEVMAVVLLLGLLAGATAWSLTGQARRATLAELTDRIAHADAMARLSARRLGEPTALRIDLDRQRLTWSSRGGVGARTAGRTVQLPSQIRFHRVRVAESAASLPGRESGLRGGDYQQGTAELPVSISGQSVTYALLLRQAPPIDDGPREVWLVVAGLSGQTLEIYETRTIDKLWQLLATGRVDAD